MNISIIIPAVNESATIESAINRAWSSGCNEVIVADGGSSDPTLEIASDLNCRLIQSETGRGIQLNEGAKIATGELLLFMHADNWLALDACDQIRKLNDDSNEAQNIWGGFRQRIANSKFRYRWLEWGNSWRARYRRLVYGDQGMFVSRSLFESLGGFQQIPIMEDYEFSTRLSKMSRPNLLAGPIHVAARRWERNGVVGQTMRNWSLIKQYRSGISPAELVQQYRRHDQ